MPHTLSIQMNWERREGANPPFFFFSFRGGEIDPVRFFFFLFSF